MSFGIFNKNPANTIRSGLTFFKLFKIILLLRSSLENKTVSMLKDLNLSKTFALGLLQYKEAILTFFRPEKYS